jgi:hypothetical protein
MITYERLEELLEFFDAKNYSGRGMHGRQCLSVTTEGGQLAFQLMEDIVTECADSGEVAEMYDGVRTDDMGLSVVLYWPNVKVPT